jgi:phosphatidylinositol alpha-1,6-mannosyltransferase
MIIIVTQCFPPALGGIENLMAGAARSLNERGHEIYVFADGKVAPSTDMSEMGSVRHFSGWKPWRNWRKIHALRGLLRNRRAEAVLTDSWKSVETLQRFGCLDRVDRVVCFAHGNELPEQASARKAERISRALSAVDRVVAVSEFTAGRVRSFASNADIVVRAPAIEPPQSVEKAEEKWAEDLWGSRVPRILSLSRLEPLKGIDHAILAVRKLLHRYPDLHYIVAGGGGDLARLEAIVRAQDLQRHVSFVGAVNGMRKSALYESANLFLMPTRPVGSRQEAFGMVFLEAAAHGLPVLAGKAGGARDALQDGITGVLVDGSDVDQIAASLDELLADPARRLAMGTAGRSFAAGFAWSNQVHALENDLQVVSPSR